MELLLALKALGDDTRFAIYSELTLSTAPVSTAEISDKLGLHPNTVRPHLERMREAGLLVVETVHRGNVGRPQNRYSLAPGAPGLGLDPPAHTLLAGLLAAMAEKVGAEAVDALEIGRAWGAKAGGRTKSAACVSVLMDELDRLGFDPGAEDLGIEVTEDGDQRQWSKVSFLHCPFRELAEAYPALVCSLHRGIVEGVVDEVGGGMVEEFSALYDRDPCNVIVTVG